MHNMHPQAQRCRTCTLHNTQVQTSFYFLNWDSFKSPKDSHMSHPKQVSSSRSFCFLNQVIPNRKVFISLTTFLNGIIMNVSSLFKESLSSKWRFVGLENQRSRSKANFSPNQREEQGLSTQEGRSQGRCRDIGHVAHVCDESHMWERVFTRKWSFPA